MLHLDKYILDKKLLSIRDTYIIRDQQKNEVGKAVKKLFSIRHKYILSDSTDRELIVIQKKILSMRPTFQFFDLQGHIIATMKKKVFKFFGTEYWFEDADGNEILRAKGKFHAHTYQFYQTQDELVAGVSKKWIAVRDSYGIEMFSPYVDRLLILSAVIGIDAIKNEEEYEEKSSSDSDFSK